MQITGEYLSNIETTAINAHGEGAPVCLENVELQDVALFTELVCYTFVDCTLSNVSIDRTRSEKHYPVTFVNCNLDRLFLDDQVVLLRKNFSGVIDRYSNTLSILDAPENPNDEELLTPGKSYSVEDFIDANKAAGKYWFSPSTMRGFNRKLFDVVYTAADFWLFISSECDDNNPRYYSINLVSPNGHVKRVNRCKTLDEAKDTCKDILYFRNALYGICSYSDSNP